MDGKGSGPRSLPSPHQLRSALRAGRLIDKSGTPLDVARSSYGRVPYNGIYRTEDLIAGERILIRAGVLREEESVLYPAAGLGELAHANDSDGAEALVLLLLDRDPPPWLLAATTGDEFAPEFIPDQELSVIEKTMDAEAREQLLLRAGRRFDATVQEQIGGAAEEYLVAQCRKQLEDAGESDLADQVRRVSLISDQLGYDVTAPRTDGSTRRLECKGTRPVAPRFFLSRNEADRAVQDPDWCLVVCSVSADETVELLGWCPGSTLKGLLPNDPPGARWSSVEIAVPDGLLAAGLPPAENA